MNYYLASRPTDPFVYYFLVGEVKSIVIKDLGEKLLAKQIYKIACNDSDANILFSSELSKSIYNTPNLLDNLVKIMEDEYSIGLVPEDDGKHLYFYPIKL